MTSEESSQNEGHTNKTWRDGFSEERCVPRPPNTVTESRVLSKVLKNDHEVTPNRDFSNPPPSSNHLPPMNASQQPLTLPKASSQLSADAKEFVPQSQVVCTSDSYPNQEYSPEESYGLSVTAAEFVPRATEGYYSYADPYYPNLLYKSYDPYPVDDFNNLTLQEPYDPYCVYRMPADNTASSILGRFNHVLDVLNYSPGNMEEYLRPICEMICGSSDTTEIVNGVVDSLFEQSLQESNFRYTGARICQFLNSSLKGNPHFSGFHKIFMNRCQKEYNIREQLKHGSPADQERLRGLSMFMAEVFLNVEAETEDGSVQRIQFLPKILVNLVKTLLSTLTDADVKCSCQLLKLSGSLIEDIVKHSPEDCIAFEEIFTQLKHIQSSPELTENARLLIGSVLKLKEADWNRSSSSPPKKPVYPETSNFQVEPVFLNRLDVPCSQTETGLSKVEPVFFNKLGVPCSRTEAGFSDEDDDDGAYILNDEEEAAFLEWQAEQEAQAGDLGKWGNNDTGYESYQLDEAADDGGMGDEMEAAYEEFLQKQNFSNSYQPHQQQQPLPNMPPPQEFYGYPQPPPHLQPPNTQAQLHMMRPNQPQNQVQQQRQEQQQQQHHFQKNDKYHYHR